MNDHPESANVSRILDAVVAGESGAVERLLPLVYDELRRLAKARVAGEKQNAQATSLVHEAYLRLIGSEQQHWPNRAYFFAAAGEAMRRILVDRARERLALKRGGDQQRVTLHDQYKGAEFDIDELLSVHDVLKQLDERDPAMANVLKLRYFVGLTIPETAEALDVSPRTVNRLWTAAHVWLRRKLSESG